MEFTPKKIFDFLNTRGITTLYHANTVSTASSFLMANKIISRGECEKLDLLQTSQYTDNKDKRLCLWNDIFLDTTDIHQRGKRANHYGPVLFEFDIDILNSLETGSICITRTNPSKWTKLSGEWFSSLDELESDFDEHTFEQMIVLRHLGSTSLTPYLKRIVLDDPRVIYTDYKTDFYSSAFGSLKLAMAIGKIDITIEKRKCPYGCRCMTSYGVAHTKDDHFIPTFE